jgi:hypothetical protein
MLPRYGGHMVGMIQIVTYLLCVYLIYKGVEIFQIAYVSQSNKRNEGIAIGIFAIVIAIIAAIVFYNMINDQATAVGNSMQNAIPQR